MQGLTETDLKLGTTHAGKLLAGVLALAIALVALGALGVIPARAGGTQGDGTLTIMKGGDRNVGSNDFEGNPNYAKPLTGASFEYSQSPGGPWTAVPGSTDANGQVSVNLAAGSYYVREKTAAPGFTNYGPLGSIDFNGSDQDYVARADVSAGHTTYTYPTRETGSRDDGSPFLNVRDNGTAPKTCGQNILLVLDRSGSIGPYKDMYEQAARGFVDELNGTPTQIGIVSFSDKVNSYSPAQGGSSLYQSPLDLGDSGSAATLNSTISNVYNAPEGATNWDGALQATAQAKGFTANGSTGQTTNPDVIVFITDGNPTISEIDDSGGNNTSLSDISAGIASANLVKTQPSRGNSKVKLLAIGVGDGVTKPNLKAVSGPVEGVDGDYAVPTVEELDAFLQELAASQCGARVYVRKHLAGDATRTNQPGWSYTAVDPRPGHTPTYLDNNNATHPNGVPPVIQTGAFFTNLPAGPTTVQMNENASQPANSFSLVDVTCREGGYEQGTEVKGTRNGLHFSLPVKRGDAIYCTYTNSLKTTLSISKTPDNQAIDAGDNAEFTITVKNTGATTAASAMVSDQLPAPGATPWTVSQQPSGGSCSINSSNLLGCSLGDITAGGTRTVKVKTTTDHESCGTYDNPMARASGENADEVTDSGRIVCQKPDIDVTKEGNDHTGPGKKVSFTIKVSNHGEAAAHDVYLHDPLSDLTGPWSIDSQSEGSDCEIGNHPGYVSDAGAEGESGQTLVCRIGDLPPGQSRTVTVSATVKAPTCRSVDNKAIVTSSNSPKADAEASVPCEMPKPELQLRKKADRKVVMPGQKVHYTILVRNRKIGSVAEDLTMCDRIPPHMTVTDRGSAHFRNGKLCWSIPRLEGSKKWSKFRYVTEVGQDAKAGQHLRNAVVLRNLRAHWTVRVKNPPVRHRRRHHSRVTG